MKAALAWMLVLTLTAFSAVAQSPDESPPLIVEDVQCKGNASTSCRFILSHLFLNGGDPVDEEEIQNAKLRLSALPDFESIDIYLEKGSRKGTARVVVEVAEASPLQTELIVGTSARVESLGQVISGRFANQNLLGTGNILDLQLATRTQLGGSAHRELFSRLQLVDPVAFDSNKYFVLGGVSWLDARQEFDNGDFLDLEQLSFDVSIGRRVWDFSYVIVGLQYAPVSETAVARRDRDGRIDTEFTGLFDDGPFVGFGWNSEDNPHFPTLGSRLFVALNRDRFETNFRKTWRTGGASFWTARLGATPRTQYRSPLDEQLGFGITYARPLRPDISRGRWYVDVGLQPLYFGADGRGDTELGLKAGVRLETRTFGLVELYLLGSTDKRPDVRR